MKALTTAEGLLHWCGEPACRQLDRRASTWLKSAECGVVFRKACLAAPEDEESSWCIQDGFYLCSRQSWAMWTQWTSRCPFVNSPMSLWTHLSLKHPPAWLAIFEKGNCPTKGAFDSNIPLKHSILYWLLDLLRKMEQKEREVSCYIPILQVARPLPPSEWSLELCQHGSPDFKELTELSCSDTRSSKWDYHRKKVITTTAN